jgi:Zn-dependent peptidase ImmA (M78 family)/transcriptional regulator with XRE-family HTH domain
MTPGTPGFNGARLDEALEARSFTIVALADLVGVTRQAISAYTKGQQTPRPEVLARLSKYLKLPELFFLSERTARSESAFFFRSMSRATVTQRSRARWRHRWMYDVAAYLAEFVELPALRFPTFKVPDEPAAISNTMIEELAAQTRRFWNVGEGPIANVVWLLENNGMIVARMDLGADELDGLSAWIEDRPCVLLNSQKPAARSRFDVAHELAHLLLHRQVDPARIDQPGVFKLIEKQAHRFAGAFLLPAPAFAADVAPIGLDRLRVLKTKWKTSIGMMIHRAADLNFISADQGRRLWMAYARRGWRRGEPYDDQWKPECPRLLERSVRLVLGEGGQTVADLTMTVPLADSDLEDIIGVEPGFFAGGPHDLPPKLKTTTPTRMGEIVPLRPSKD